MGGAGSGAKGGARRCGICRQFGHRKETCPELRTKAMKPIVAARTAIEAGDVIIVVEDAEDEVDTLAVWRGDEVWVAVAPTGRQVAAIDEWTLRSGDRCQDGYPQLHPFLRQPPPGTSMNIPLIGMGPGAKGVLPDPVEETPVEPVAEDPEEEPSIVPACIVQQRTGRPCRSCGRPAAVHTLPDLRRLAV